MRALVLLRQILRTIRRDDSGQSLIVIVSAMTVLLGIAGFALDTATWMVRHHNDQVVADSAALAAAQCLANPGQPNPIDLAGTVEILPACTSATDLPHAWPVAVAYAKANGVTITQANVSLAHNTVTVKASTSTPTVFARVMGIGTTSQTAQAGASWTATQQCTTVGQTCDFMFANGTRCSLNSPALDVATQGASTINGGVQTNGYVYATEIGNGGGINGAGNYGASCTDRNTHGGNHDPWKIGDPTQASQAMAWPIDYSKDFPACAAGTTNPCQSNGYPSFCTNEGTNIVLDDSTPADTPSPGQIYCASGSGTSVLKSDPSTWTGTISITSSPNATNVWTDTFVAGAIHYTGSGGDTISSCGYTASGYSSSTCSGSGSSSPPPAPATPNYPVFYVVGSDPNPTTCTAALVNPSTSCALSLNSGGNLTLDGDVFVQNGTANLDFQGNQSAGNTFIEANAIGASVAGNFDGDGPVPTGGSGSNSSGSVALVQ